MVQKRQTKVEPDKTKAQGIGAKKGFVLSGFLNFQE